MNSSLSDYLQACQTRVNHALEKILPSEDKVPTRLHQAMRYAVLNGGKRLRPALVYATSELLNDPTEDIAARLDAAACAVELIHCYSLVHDDLPSMDNDTLRRGKPTCHVKYDEATAILVGDALQSLAFQCVSNSRVASHILVLSELSKAAGSLGMAGGQALDIESTGKQLTIDELKHIHEMKTGSLIIASVRMAAFSSYDISEDQLKSLTQYASALGLAFQVQDDILDVEGSEENLGKTAGKDAAQDKNTYTKILGIEKAKQYAKELNKKAVESLEPFDHRADRLRELADYAISRQH